MTINTLFTAGAIAMGAQRGGRKGKKVRDGSGKTWIGFTKRPGKPTVYLTAEAKAQLDAYIAAAYGEVSGMGTVEIRGDDLVVTGLMLFKQRSGPSNTDIDPEDLADYLTELVDNGGDPDSIHLWWHSHAEMNLFWSGTDDATIHRFRYAGWLLSIVGNHKEELRARLDVFHPVPVELDNLPIVVLHEEGDTVNAEALQAEVEDKVGGWRSGGSWSGGRKSDTVGPVVRYAARVMDDGPIPTGVSFMLPDGYTSADITNVANNQDGTVTVTYRDGKTVRMDAYGAPLRDSEDEAAPSGGAPVHDPFKDDPDIPVI